MLALLMGMCFPFLDDGDGDVAGNLIAWSIGAYAILGCWMTQRRTPQRLIWWLVDSLLHVFLIYTMWVTPLICWISDAWYAAPWILGWYLLQWSAARRRSQVPAWVDTDADTWRALSSTLIYLLAPGALLLAIGGVWAGEDMLAYASWLLNLPALLVAMALPLFALEQVISPRNRPRSAPRFTDRIVEWRRQN